MVEITDDNSNDAQGDNDGNVIINSDDKYEQQVTIITLKNLLEMRRGIITQAGDNCNDNNNKKLV